MTDINSIPAGWKKTHFQQLTYSIKSGLSRRIVPQDIGIPVLISGNIQENRLDVSDLKYWYIDDPQGADTSKYILEDGDILLCFINSLSQIGKVCVFKDIGRPAIYTTNLFRIVASEKHNSSFVYQLITFKEFQDEIQLITKPAVNQASFTKGDLENIPVTIPPLPEQQKIAKILSSVDEVIEKTQAQIDKLKDLKTGMMQELLSPTEGSKQAIAMGYTEFKDSPLGRIPVEWEIAPLADHIISKKSGAALKPSDFSTEGVKVIPKKAIQHGGRLVLDKKMTYCTHQFAVSNAKSIVDSDYFAVVLRDLVPAGPNIGLIVEIDQDDSFILAQGVYGFIPDENLSGKFLAQLSNSDWYRKEMRKILVGSTQVHVRSSEFFELQVPVPPAADQAKTVRCLESIDSNILVLNRKVEALKSSKKGLMQDLLSGIIRVKVD